MSLPEGLDWPKLKSYPIFQDLSDDELSSFLHGTRIDRFDSGYTLIRQGDPGHGLGILLQGKVKITRTDPDGHEHFLSVLKEGDFFGEMALLGTGTRSANVAALEQTQVVWVSADDFHRFLEGASPLIAKVLARIVADLSNRLRLLTERYVFMKTHLTTPRPAGE